MINVTPSSRWSPLRRRRRHCALVSKWAPLGSRATTVAGRGTRNRIQEGAEEREPSEVAANARIKVRGVICQVRGVTCQVERQRAGKSNAEA
jgi:hypothetical protein